MKNYHLDLIKVTESGAVAAAQWVGRGNKEFADKAATDAMRDRLNSMDFRAEIAIGEGIKDGSYGLYKGEKIGKTHHNQTEELIQKFKDVNECVGVHQYEIAVDPIEGTTPTAKGGNEAISVIALANRDCFYKTENFYMDKIAFGPLASNVTTKMINFNLPVVNNIQLLSLATQKEIQHLTICILDRPRTKPLIDELRKIGCRIKFISDCDVTACIATCVPESGVDMYWSIGGAPEAVIAASAMKCMGGTLKCREVINCETFECSDKVLEIEDLVKGDCMFSATGITDGQLLKGVSFTANGPITESITMRSESGTIRRIMTQHGN